MKFVLNIKNNTFTYELTIKRLVILQRKQTNPQKITQTHTHTRNSKQNKETEPRNQQEIEKIK